MKYSIVIPAHNEAEHLIPFVREFIAALPDGMRPFVSEILVVENGSRDDTLGQARKLGEEFPDLVRVLSLERGSYGEAIRRGMMEAQGTHLSILECDFLDPRYVADSVALFQSTAARFILASKRHPLSLDNRPMKRRVLTAMFNAILHLGTGYPGSDTHGLKSMETALARQLCQEAISTDEIFQTEIVLLAWRWGNSIYELPISIRERRAVSVSIRKRFPMVVGAVRALRRSLKRYPKPRPVPQIVRVSP